MSLLIGLEKGGDGNTTELLAALEESDLEDEEIADRLTTELLDKLASGSGRTTCKRHC